MNFTKLLLRPYKLYAKFGGRSQRLEFLLFSITTTIAIFVVAVLELAGQAQIPVFSLVMIGALFVPSMTLWNRRFHDFGVEGGWIGYVTLFVISIIVEISGSVDAIDAVYLGSLIIWLIVLIIPGNKKENKYGKPPA
ncbi:MAG: DUF805 domain-containing protein [Proteobacteria bacterium]|nr:DUF805 domain-containing protein [Pseudomonadota bacterium]